MFSKIILATLCTILLVSSANARPRHHHHHHRHHHHVWPGYGKRLVEAPFFFGLFEAPHAVSRQPVHNPRSERHAHRRAPEGLARVMADGTGKIARPSRYISGRLICARNVNSALSELGIRGTGSALAKSFLNWGMKSGPVPGAVAVSSRRGGGHVAIVSRIVDGQVYVWNPSPRGRGWQEQPYRHRAIAFRVAANGDRS